MALARSGNSDRLAEMRNGFFHQIRSLSNFHTQWLPEDILKEILKDFTCIYSSPRNERESQDLALARQLLALLLDLVTSLLKIKRGYPDDLFASRKPGLLMHYFILHLQQRSHLLVQDSPLTLLLSVFFSVYSYYLEKMNKELRDKLAIIDVWENTLQLFSTGFSDEYKKNFENNSIDITTGWPSYLKEYNDNISSADRIQFTTMLLDVLNTALTRRSQQLTIRVITALIERMDWLTPQAHVLLEEHLRTYNKLFNQSDSPDLYSTYVLKLKSAGITTTASLIVSTLHCLPLTGRKLSRIPQYIEWMEESDRASAIRLLLTVMHNDRHQVSLRINAASALCQIAKYIPPNYREEFAQALSNVLNSGISEPKKIRDLIKTVSEQVDFFKTKCLGLNLNHLLLSYFQWTQSEDILPVLGAFYHLTELGKLADILVQDNLATIIETFLSPLKHYAVTGSSGDNKEMIPPAIDMLRHCQHRFEPVVQRALLDCLLAVSRHDPANSFKGKLQVFAILALLDMKLVTREIQEDLANRFIEIVYPEGKEHKSLYSHHYLAIEKLMRVNDRIIDCLLHHFLNAPNSLLTRFIVRIKPLIPDEKLRALTAHLERNTTAFRLSEWAAIRQLIIPARRTAIIDKKMRELMWSNTQFLTEFNFFKTSDDMIPLGDLSQRMKIKLLFLLSGHTFEGSSRIARLVYFSKLLQDYRRDLVLDPGGAITSRPVLPNDIIKDIVARAYRR